MAGRISAEALRRGGLALFLVGLVALFLVAGLRGWLGPVLPTVADVAGSAAPPPPPEAGGSLPAGGTAPGTAQSAPASAAASAAATARPTSPTTWTAPRFTDRQDQRDEMVRTIRAYGLTDRAVLAAMSAVPRHEFVLPTYLSSAYADTPLPIGHGQTISQPYMVAEMTRQLQLRPTSRVLEIGTGSGYQAAVLTEFTPHVFSIEIVRPLATAAEQRLRRLGYSAAQVRRADGFDGWPDKAPFDAIIVTCAAGQIPPPLIRQLAAGGRMVIPIGGPFAIQSLMLVEKQPDGGIRSRNLMGCRFVPLLREDPSRR